jgi:hypothetical protein
VLGQYDKAIDRESAHEVLEKRAKGVESRREEAGGTLGGRRDVEYDRHGEFQVPKIPRGDTEGYVRERAEEQRSGRRSSGGGYQRQTAGEAFTKSLLRSLGTAVGGAIGNILRGRR